MPKFRRVWLAFALGDVIDGDRRVALCGRPGDGNRFDHAGHATHRPFDFAEVDAISVYVDDEVASPHEKDPPVVQLVAQIARRNRQIERLYLAAARVPISAGQHHAGDANLPDCVRRRTSSLVS